MKLRLQGPWSPLGIVLLLVVLGVAYSALASNDSLFSYIVKQGFMQGGMLLKAKDVDDVLKEETLDPQSRRYLTISKKIILFAQDDLGMSTGRSYRKFIRLDRPWVTQLVVAAYQEKFEPYLIHYPIVGDLPYKGFFEEDDAIQFQESLKAKNLDTYRRPVEAFSTTGWLPDPVLSTMFSSEGRFTELLFHELTHSTFYFKSAADFNEAFASWMGFKGALFFVEKNRDSYTKPVELIAELRADHEYQLRLAKVIREILAYAKAFYAKPDAGKHRQELFDWIKARFAKETGFTRYATREWNNALLLGLGTYYEMVQPIDEYAIRHKLEPKDFLKLVKERGPAIIEDILKGR